MPQDTNLRALSVELVYIELNLYLGRMEPYDDIPTTSHQREPISFLEARGHTHVALLPTLLTPKAHSLCYKVSENRQLGK